MGAHLTSTQLAPGPLRHPAKPARLAIGGKSDHVQPRAWLTAAQTALSALFPPPDHPLFRGLLEARGEYDPAKNGTASPEPLTVSERLELLANGEVLARYYRHPATLAHAVEAGASWEQIGAARGASAEQARQDYREWAEGQHNLWTGKWGGEPGRSGLDDAGYAAAIARTGAPDPGAAKAYADTHQVLCTHADDGQPAHWLEPGEKCTRGDTGQ